MPDVGILEPLIPDQRVLGPLQERASALVEGCHRLGASAGTSLAQALRPLLRAMNSYYTNKIEGQHTRPADIERALTAQFDADVRQARKQRLALAHMAAEEELENACAGQSGAVMFSQHRIKEIHAALYQRLPESERVSDEGQPIAPGHWRQTEVVAGRHLAPAYGDVPALLEHWGWAYGRVAGAELRVIGAACAHQRLLWIHPFLDGNGRTARLHSHLVLHGLGLSQGLWSPMRGLARQQENYYARLNNADLPRRNDLDGRGPLSQEELVAFADFFLKICIDQVSFMSQLLEFRGLRDRLSDLLMFLAARPWQIGSERSLIKPEALEALHYTALVGSVERARFLAMTGLPPRNARRVLASLLHAGLLQSPTSRAPVSFAVPQRSLRFLFPRLWIEAEGGE